MDTVSPRGPRSIDSIAFGGRGCRPAGRTARSSAGHGRTRSRGPRGPTGHACPVRVLAHSAGAPLQGVRRVASMALRPANGVSPRPGMVCGARTLIASSATEGIPMSEESNAAPRPLTVGLLLVRIGFWLLVLGAILPILAFSEAISQRRNIAEDPKFLTVTPFYLLPGCVLDLIGRFLCCRLPLRWGVLRPYAVSAAMLSCAGIGLVGLAAVDLQLGLFGMASMPSIVGLIGLIACVAGWISFVEFLRRFARQVNDEPLQWYAITVIGLWVACATIVVCIGLLILPNMALIAVAVLGLLFLHHYEKLLSRSRSAALLHGQVTKGMGPC